VATSGIRKNQVRVSEVAKKFFAVTTTIALSGKIIFHSFNFAGKSCIK